MAGTGFKTMVGVMVAGSLMFSSTGAVAATASAAAPQINPWAALAVMSGGSPAAAVCGAAAAAAAAAQAPSGCVLPQLDVPPPVATSAPPPPIPVPPVEPAGAGLGISPLILALGALAAGVALYFALRNHHGNSPG